MERNLFRGQIRRKGEKFLGSTPLDSIWVSGPGACFGEGVYSVVYTCNPVEKHTVYTNTLNAWSGLYDKNGKQMFKDDIVTGLFLFSKPVHGVVDIHEGAFGLRWWRGDVEMFNAFACMCNVEYEVVGNIHDNPELIQKD